LTCRDFANFGGLCDNVCFLRESGNSQGESGRLGGSRWKAESGKFTLHVFSLNSLRYHEHFKLCGSIVRVKPQRKANPVNRNC